jgi:uncharacterized iron-regulated membrane protein
VNTLRSVHRWIGIALAVPVLLVALSGGLLLLRDPCYRARLPGVATPITAAQQSGYPAVLHSIETQFVQDGIRLIRFPRAGVNAFQVYLGDQSEALVDPRNGQVLARWRWHEDPFALLFQLHAHLLAGAPGEVLNGILALLVVFMGLTGCWLWWPRRRRGLELRHVVPRNTRRRAMIQSHAAVGVWLLLPAIAFCATGAGLVFYAPLGAAIAAISRPAEEPAAVVVPTRNPRRSWNDILRTVGAALPEAGPTMYYAGSERNAVLTFRKRLPGEWHPNGRSYVLVDPYTATVVQSIDARRQGVGTRMMHALYPLHAARIGGPLLIAIAAAASAALTWLAAGGLWAWLRRSARHATASAPVSEGTRGQRPSARDAGREEDPEAADSRARDRQFGQVV